MFFRKYDVIGTDAKTLNVEYIGNNMSGWLIKGDIKEDYYEWVNYFQAIHPIYGKVFGDFEKGVFASSEKALKHFIKHHPYEVWDYYDI